MERTVIKILPPDQASIRVHSNGFLQAETACGNKIHIWDDRLPRQSVPTKIHNHNHGFQSELVIGSLAIQEFAFCQGDNYVAHQCVPRKGKDTRLEPVGNPVGVCVIREFELYAPSSYTFPLDINLYHEVTPLTDLVMTFVTRQDRDESFLPTVLVPVDSKPDNNFDRYAYQDIALRVYEDVLYEDILSNKDVLQSYSFAYV